MDSLEVTVADVRELLDAPHEDPVLYVNDDGALEIWASAHVPHHAIVCTRAQVAEALMPPGADPLTADDIAEHLPLIQQSLDEVLQH